MIQTVNFIFIFLISLSFTKDLPLSYKYELSFGYDDNFMRFSGSELNTNHNSNGSENDYLGDSKTYDSGILGTSLQIKYSPKIINTYKSNIISKIKYNYYSSSDQKSYTSFLFRYEIKLASYKWLKFSYSLMPDYYLRTYIDRDLTPYKRFPCTFSNETIYFSFSHKFLFDKTWIDYRFVLNNQFYNKYFTEFDSKISGIEITLKSKKVKNYYTSATLLYYKSDNVSYNPIENLQSSLMDRSYLRNGVKFNFKRTLKHSFLNTLGLKFYFNKRFYDLNSSFYDQDNWKTYSDYDLRFELSKKISNSIDLIFSTRHFKRIVNSSNSSEVDWVEDYKNYNRNEMWLKFVYIF
tara:strand:- start:13697 stop:14746 length:1050 start_codon:yes stop_codon:yes gene_type:complete